MYMYIVISRVLMTTVLQRHKARELCCMDRSQAVPVTIGSRSPSSPLFRDRVDLD